MSARRDARLIQGSSLPRFLYGTAWKEARTQELTRQALDAGFRGIDTANQRKHYVEAAVGDAVASAIGDGRVAREDLFLQTKFTSLRGQDQRLPYDRAAPPEVQVAQSLRASLDHLHTTYVDAYLLHGPESSRGIGAYDRAVWRAMEAQHDAGLARLLGVSNVSREQLQVLHGESRIKPAFVQNRCFAAQGWDRDVRAYCDVSGIVYQGFSLLTANPRALRSPAVAQAARRTGKTPAQVVFRFSLQAGMLPLTGTSSLRHMREDLACDEFELHEDEMHAVERAEV